MHETNGKLVQEVGCVSLIHMIKEI